MRKRVLSLILAALLLFGVFGLAGCGESTEDAQSGAYITKKSWEYAVVCGDTLSVYLGEQCYVFRLAVVGSVYVCENLRATATVKFSGDKLSVVLKYANSPMTPRKRLRLERDLSIAVAESAPVLLEAPKPAITAGGLQWRFDELQGLGESVLTLLRQRGILGAAVEVKFTGTDSFEPVHIQDFYPEPDCLFVLNFHDYNLVQGENIIRVRHIGGAFVRYGKVYLSENSEAVSFRVTVDAEGNITMEELPPPTT